jgi:tetratricopeptide (TPR) repeat protein
MSEPFGSLGVGAPPDSVPGGGRPFVGRARELLELEAGLDRGRIPEAPLYLITGEPGIGKTRLMQEVEPLASSHGWRVLAARCWEGGGAPAYWPWIQVVRAAGGSFEALSAAPKRGATTSLDPETVRFRLFDDVTRFLYDAARERPVVVMLDDLHAADEPSLLLLRFLAIAPQTDRLLIVATYRKHEIAVRERAELFGDLVRLGHRIHVGGLKRDDVGAYVERAVGHSPSPVVVERLHDVTGGNPFFLGEIVRELLAAGPSIESTLGDAKVRIPEEVRALIRRRVAGLSKEAGGLLRTAAVVGREFDLQILERTSRLSVGRLLNVLQEAADAGIITQMAGGSSYSFAHDLVRDTLYDDLAPSRRLELHERIGRVIEAVAEHDLESHLAEIAHHYAQSAPLGHAREAVDYSVRAGDRAAAVLAYEDAAGHYARALQLLPQADHGPADRCEILLRLGDVHWRSGDAEVAEATFEEAAVLAGSIQQSEGLARAALGHVACRARLTLGALLIGAKTPRGSKAVGMLQEALEALPLGDSGLRARLLARLATELYNTERPEVRLEVSDQAVEMARRLGDPEALVEALLGRHWASLAPDLVDARLANAGEMLSVATAMGDLEMAILARHCRLHAYLELGDIRTVDTELDAMASLADRSGQPFHRWHVVCLRATRAILEGRLEDGVRLAEEALRIGKIRHSEFGSYMFEFAHGVAIGWTNGTLDRLGNTIRGHGERYPGIARWRDALLAAELGDEVAARFELERHASGDFADLPLDGLWILHVCSLAQAAVLVRDERHAARLYQLLLPYAGRLAVSVSTLPFGPVAMRLGMLASLRGRWDEAESHFEAATKLCEEIGARPAMAHVLIEHARALFDRGKAAEKDRAEDLSNRAAGLARGLGLNGLAERASALSRSTRPGFGGRAHEEAVFRREGEYWTVAYAGRMARLRGTKGMRYIACLLASPGKELHVLELVQVSEGAPAIVETVDVGGAAEAGLRTSGLATVGGVLDARAKEEYRRRLKDLSDEREEARSWNDEERKARIDAEIDALTRELTGALGLGGASRDFPSPAERARVAVTKAIRSAARAIARECPPLGDHLAASLRTGRFCSYAPPGEAPPRWAL